jgi:hypothetical protein
MIIPNVNPAASWLGESLAKRACNTLRKMATAGIRIRIPFRKEAGMTWREIGRKARAQHRRPARVALWRLSTAAMRQLDSERAPLAA